MNRLVLLLGAIGFLATLVWLPFVVIANSGTTHYCLPRTFPRAEIAVAGAVGVLAGLSLPFLVYRFRREKGATAFLLSLVVGLGGFAAWWLLDGFDAARCVQG